MSLYAKIRMHYLIFKRDFLANAIEGEAKRIKKKKKKEKEKRSRKTILETS